jgi:hypothetical protein
MIASELNNRDVKGFPFLYFYKEVKKILRKLKTNILIELFFQNNFGWGVILFVRITLFAGRNKVSSCAFSTSRNRYNMIHSQQLSYKIASAIMTNS